MKFSIDSILSRASEDDDQDDDQTQDQDHHPQQQQQPPHQQQQSQSQHQSSHHQQQHQHQHQQLHQRQQQQQHQQQHQQQQQQEQEQEQAHHRHQANLIASFVAHQQQQMAAASRLPTPNQFRPSAEPISPLLAQFHSVQQAAAMAAVAAAGHHHLMGVHPNHTYAGLHRLLHPYRKPKRIRTAFSPGQLIQLENSFEGNHYVVGTERKHLAQRLNLSETQVKVWFQNRRTKHKRQKQESAEIDDDASFSNSSND